jgi:hypothetical protein
MMWRQPRPGAQKIPDALGELKILKIILVRFNILLNLLAMRGRRPKAIAD